MATHPRQFPDDPGVSEDARVTSGSRQDHSDDDDVETVWYITALQRWSLLILLVAVLGGAAGFFYAGLRPLAYQGITTLLVVPPSQPTGAQINPATFRAIVENATLASQVIDELKLQPMTAPTFVEWALAVEEVRGTTVGVSGRDSSSALLLQAWVGAHGRRAPGA